MYTVTASTNHGCLETKDARLCNNLCESAHLQHCYHGFSQKVHVLIKKKRGNFHIVIWRHLGEDLRVLLRCFSTNKSILNNEREVTQLRWHNQQIQCFIWGWVRGQGKLPSPNYPIPTAKETARLFFWTIFPDLLTPKMKLPLTVYLVAWRNYSYRRLATLVVLSGISASSSSW